MEMVTYLLFVLGAGHSHGLWHDIGSEDDLGDSSAGQSLDLVAKDRLVAEVDEWLGHCERHGSKPRAEPSN